jgi:oxygen-independent coproporphyrinogen III oxidase
MREAPVDAWLEAVARELELLRVERGWERLSLDSIYVGGGTPSLLGTGAMAALAERLSRHADWDAASVEWTCEANPESFSAALAADWRRAGVNRISLGVQSFDAEVLRWMGRLHGPEGPRRAVEAAREGGIDDLSVDLIFGLPSRLGRDWTTDLELALSLAPDHVSLYGLTAEAGAPLGRWVREGRETLADDDRYAEEYLAAHRCLTAAGFEHYEVSNFARPGRRSRHNSVYWVGAPYAALGPGAHAFYPPLRRWNLRGWAAYRDAVSRGELPIEGHELVAPEEVRLERVWLALRTDEGLQSNELAPVQQQLVAAWIDRGWARDVDGVLRLTADGWLLLDRLSVEFAAAADAASGI